MKSLEEYIQAAAKDGDTRSGIIQGIRMAVIALKELGIEEPKQTHRLLIAFVEVDRCLPDAVGLVTGCRLGNRTLKFKDLGKMAATFLDLRTERAIRIAARESANERARETFPDLEKEEALRRAYREFSDQEMFTRQWVRANLPAEERPGYRAPRVLCAECGEGINFGREILRDGRALCLACAGQGYFEPL